MARKSDWPCKCRHLKSEHYLFPNYPNVGDCTVVMDSSDFTYKMCKCTDYRPKSNFAYLHWFKLYAKKYKLKR